jgi:superfamily II DNA helicase RecQ
MKDEKWIISPCFRAEAYHAGLKDAQRTKVQEEWSNNMVQEEVDCLDAERVAQM